MKNRTALSLFPVLALLAVVVLVALVGGCSAYQRVKDSPVSSAAVGMALQQGVMRYVEAQADPTSTALRILAGANAVLDVANTGPVTLARLREVALAHIDPSSPADYQLATDFVDLAAVIVAREVADGQIDATDEVESLQRVAAWFVQAARAYIPPEIE